MKNNLWLISLGWLFTTFVFAQEKPANTTYSFTLDEAIEYGLENSTESINARREVAKAIKKKWETTADGLPQINGEVNYQNQLKQTVSLMPAEFSGGAPGTFVPLIFGTKQQATAAATLTQLIFNGTYLVGLEAAKTFLQYTNDVEEKTQLEVKKGIINSYGSVLVAQESVKILKNNTSILEKNVTETQKIFENGLAEEENVEQLQITLSQLQNQLQNANRLEKIAKQMLNITIGVPLDATVILTDTLENLAVKNIESSKIETPFSIENNIDYRLAYIQTEQRRLEHKLEQSRSLPVLAAFANLGVQGYSNTFSFLDGDQRWFNSAIVGASLNIPLFSSGKSGARKKQAKLAKEQSIDNFSKAQQQIQLAYNNASSDFQFAIESYTNAKENLALAERIEKKNQIKYGEGLASSFQLRQAQMQLYASQNETLNAMLAIINKKAALETIINTQHN